MRSFWFYTYNVIAVPVLYAGFYFISLFHKKVRKGIRVRKTLFQDLEKRVRSFDGKGPRFWIHNSSMGEFEQAKPLIEALKQRFPDGSVIVSFYSPSGFENVQNYPHADILCYLPFDSYGKAKRFVATIQPDVAIMVRHDLWPNHLWRLKMQNIPAILINCSVRPKYWFHLPFLCAASRSFFQYFDSVLAVSQETKFYWNRYRLGFQEVNVVGDTRYDQVVRRAKEAEKIVTPLRKLKRQRKCVVFGSTWPSDEEAIFEAMRRLHETKTDLWMVVVPHEPVVEHLDQISERLNQMNMRFAFFSQIEKHPDMDTDVLVVDRIGILASLYALGDFSFVGGGFGPGVHNVLEPAALGKVVIFGPKHTNSFEAVQLKKRGVGFEVKSGDDLFMFILSFLKDEKRLSELGEKAAALVRENVGATERIVKYIETTIRS
jgi:3-deoxy-D-manno-octulosonic-acid transferase